ncbi:GAF domain-containing sensor histidine kinase [Candidatus Dojkabacteria bacterium]|uniref:histidine kinase n=1 Tax=Candidatus Dojkabacteria bacterium TaxID=2099670 RepID=A0A955L6B9_9BACT|nr:GAF domain-containing sensor histidine kinase [Candidatus Dojkabacteria bacterium]
MSFLKRHSKDNITSSNYNAKRLEAVIEVNRAMTGITNEDEVLSLITNKLINLLGISYASIWKYEEEDELLRLKNVNVPKPVAYLIEKFMGKSISQTYYDLNDPEHNKNLTVQTFKEGKLLETNKLSDVSYPLISENASLTIENILRMKYALHIPLIAANKKLGVLGLIWNSKEISSDDKDLIMTFSNQISTTLYNTQLFSKANNQIKLLEDKNTELQSLFNLTSEVSKTLNYDEVAQRAVDSLPQNQDLLGGVLTTYDPKTKLVAVKAVSQNALSVQVKKIVGDFEKITMDLNDPANASNPTNTVINDRKPYFSNELAESISPPLPSKVVGAIQNVVNIKCAAEYPVFVRSEVRGTITFYIKSKSKEEIDDNMKRLLSTFSLQIGIALENALLFEQSQKQQRELEEALAKLKDARQRERDMIDVMGHELRTPISIVRNALLILDGEHKKNGAISEEKLDKYLDMAIESVRREITLIETLLASTKIEGNRIQLKYTKIDMLDVVGDSIEAHERIAIQKGLKINYEKPDHDIEAYADRVRTQEVMDNFLSNAIKYTAEGEVTIRLHADGGMARIDISDTGIGISQEDLEHLGKKFFRANQLMRDEATQVHPGGTGLGLYVTFELIKVMGGRKWINSEQGKGSTFSFALPLYQGQADKEFDQTFMSNEKH